MRQWASFKSDPKKKLHFLMSPEMKLCIDRFFFNHYCQAFRRGAFARANCSMWAIFIIISDIQVVCWSRIDRPMLNMCNDHGEFVLSKSWLVGLTRVCLHLQILYAFLISKHKWKPNFRLLLRLKVLAAVSAAVYWAREDNKIIPVIQIQTIFKKNLSFDS